MILNAPTLADAAAEIVARTTTTPPRPGRRTGNGYDITKDSDPRHGRKAGYDAHLRAGTPACRACLRATARSTKFYEVLSAQGISRRHHPCTVKRRLQALIALGYTYSDLDRELNTERHVWGWVNRDVAYYPQDTYDRVKALYDRLHMTPPVATTKREALEIRRAKERARENGWPLPLMWDEDTIDDPDAHPSGALTPPVHIPGRPPNFRPDIHQPRAAKLLDCNHRQMSLPAVTREMKMDPKALDKWVRDHDGLCGILVRTRNAIAARSGDWSNGTGRTTAA